MCLSTYSCRRYSQFQEEYSMAQIVKSPSVHGYLTKLQCWYHSSSCSIHAIVFHYLLPSGKLPLTLVISAIEPTFLLICIKFILVTNTCFYSYSSQLAELIALPVKSCLCVCESVSVAVCLCVNQDVTNHDCCMWRLVIRYGDPDIPADSSP